MLILNYSFFADRLIAKFEIDGSLKSNDYRKIVAIPTKLNQV
jgi:hypothetical protein